jgi:hypothetical protein
MTAAIMRSTEMDKAGVYAARSESVSSAVIRV